MSAPEFPAAGAAVLGYRQLASLAPGDSIRFMSPAGPGLAIKNGDGTWSGTGVREAMVDHLLWPEITEVTVIASAKVEAHA